MTLREDEFGLQAVGSLLNLAASPRVWLGGKCIAVRRRAEGWLAGRTRPPTGPIDLAVLCPESPDEAVYFATKLRGRLADDGAVWVAVECAEMVSSVESAFSKDVADVPAWTVGEVFAANGVQLIRLHRDNDRPR